jgi:hypothetical protein
VTALLTSCIAFACPVGTAASRPRVLFAAVERNGSVSLRNAAAQDVHRASPGVYTITVRDRSPNHSFRFSGPAGIGERATGKHFVGVVRWRLRLYPATYVYSSGANSRFRRVLRVA